MNLRAHAIGSGFVEVRFFHRAQDARLNGRQDACHYTDSRDERPRGAVAPGLPLQSLTSETVVP